MHNKKIAIIGAGPSGLSAAWALRELGFNDVTIFEKSSRVGGMSLSKTYQGANGRKIVYEMGSLQPFGSFKLRKLLKYYGIHLQKNYRLHDPKYNSRDGYSKIYSIADQAFKVDFTKYHLGFPLSLSLLSDIVKIAKSFLKYRKLIRPGFHHYANKEELAELTTPINQWIKKQKFKLLEETVQTRCGFVLNGGSYEKNGDHPVMLALKSFLVGLFPPYNYTLGRTTTANEGYQELWNRLALDYNILFNSKITKITRNCGVDNRKVKIINNDIEQEFDQLIIACQPVNLLQIMDYNNEELDIINKIKHSPVWTVAFLGKKPVKNVENYVILDEVMGINKEPVLGAIANYGQVADDVWLYSGIVGLDQKAGLAAALKHSKPAIKTALGIEVLEWIDQMYWPQYGSHFACSDVKNGIYPKFDSMQGLNQTLYTGEILAGSSHGKCLEYSYYLVNRFFS